MEHTILVVEDDVAIADSIQIYLKNEGYNVLKAYDGIDGIKKFNDNEISLVIMDLMLPNLKGEDAILKLREESYVPIIILSAKSEDYDKVIGLNIGADDYITKPFNPLELIARVKSNLRRFYNYTNKAETGKIVVGDAVLSTEDKTITVNDKKIELTSIEYKILKLLMSNPGRIFSIEEIYERVWEEPAIEAKTVTVHIRRIREKIEVDPKHPRYLQVQWGLGYKFVKR